MAGCDVLHKCGIVNLTCPLKQPKSQYLQQKLPLHTVSIISMNKCDLSDLFRSHLDNLPNIHFKQQLFDSREKCDCAIDVIKCLLVVFVVLCPYTTLPLKISL